MPEDNLTLEFVKCRLLDEEIKCRGKEIGPSVPKREPAAFVGKPTGTKHKWKCFVCHKAAECPDREKKKDGKKKTSANVTEENSGGVICFTAGRDCGRKIVWLADSGASEHMTNDKSVFETLDEPVEISVALNGQSAIAKFRSSVEVIAAIGNETRECTLENVLYAPDVRCNLFSIRKVDMAGMEVFFKNSGVKVLKDGKVVASGRRRGMQYEMDFYAKKEDAASLYSCGKIRKDNELWHQRFGHLSEKNLENIMQKNMVNGLEQKTTRIKRYHSTIAQVIVFALFVLSFTGS